MAFQPATERIWSIARLTAEIKSTLGNAFPAVWVKGELSNVKRHSNGHLYFALKDAHAKIDAVMFRLKLQRLPFDPTDGMQVEAFGAVSVYEAQGRYQLVVEDMKPAGLGQLLAAMEKLRQQLQAEGLFDAARKRALPRYPATIGIVTSPVGAAVRDMVKVLRARWPSLRIVIAPVKVQGQTAAREIADAVARFNRLPGVDVLIVGRGGGAPEDLWAFNEEPVVRAIAASRIPVISAVGHESDTTLADFAADVRAATPSHAAEIAVRDRHQVAQSVGDCADELRRAIEETLARRRRRLEQLLAAHGFRRHDDVIAMHQKDVDDLLERARRATLTRFEH
ncbi:MAG TPA: exodeoxyribonuclease VII large subunit, partial [Candidatus Eisenbacteria bacterium]|nr:exodeoxyribonuclease VII large subunit [Candidatus Eisenbacteria bacterium]